ncbi:hypothetical protein PZA11_002151 [Diplocarpon coronariae]
MPSSSSDPIPRLARTSGKLRERRCNGDKPCGTCTRRSLPCTYASELESQHAQPSPNKRSKMGSEVDEANGTPEGSSFATPAVDPQQPVPSNSHITNPFQRNHGSSAGTSGPTKPPNRLPDGADRNADSREADRRVSRMRGSSAPDEEAVVYTNARMLQDPTGRLLYIGDSASLSFLQLIRMIVENVSGPSRFTQDPNRHRIVENTASLPPGTRHTHLLPDRETADVLVESYFTNVNGFMEVCHRKTFITTLEQCFTDPLHVDPHWLCLLHLILAIGLVMASPRPGTPEDITVRRLRADPVDRAEVFYQNAKNLCDPSTGFEDSGFWSIQALTLMTVYMLAASRRNAAYAYFGMAVRSAFALGLHREETMCIFGAAEQSVRKNLWRSLFVLDRFLATSLGRPTAIREGDCSGATLLTGEKAPFPQAPSPTAANASCTSSSALGLEAAVRSCRVVGTILEKVYSKRKISTKLAQEIADSCRGWPDALDPSLDHRQAASASPEQGVAILHVNLLYCHSVILLTRPFFLFLMNKAYQNPQPNHRSSASRMERFGAACVVASTQSIVLVQNAYDNHYLSQRNPFVLSFLFAASLVVLANEFCGLYHNPSANSFNNAINIIHYFCEQDSQARRLVVILESFREVVVQQQSLRARQGGTRLPDGSVQTAAMSLANSRDALADLFRGSLPVVNLNGAILPIPGVGTARARPNPPTTTPFSPLSPAPPQSLSAFSPSHDVRALQHDSFDAFFDLARLPSDPQNSRAGSDGNESLGEVEFDFDTFWQLPTSCALLTPGAAAGPASGGLLDEPSNQNELQGTSDSRVPQYEPRSAFRGELGGL